MKNIDSQPQIPAEEATKAKTYVQGCVPKELCTRQCYASCTLFSSLYQLYTYPIFNSALHVQLRSHLTPRKTPKHVVGLYSPFFSQLVMSLFLQHLYGLLHISKTKTHTYSIDSTWHTLMCSHPTRVIARDVKRTTLSPCQLPIIKLSHLHNYNTRVVPITYSKTIKNVKENVVG